MLKCKVTKRELKEAYYNIVSCSYCDTQYLLRRNVPRYYYANVYGWRFDVYEIESNFIITDGYSYLVHHKEQDKLNKIINKYNDNARIILSNYDYKIIDKKIKNNLNKCIKELKEVLQNEQY